MSFGKRPSTNVAAHAQQEPPRPDPHGRRKVFPDEIWNGPHGEMLRMLGMSPGDESNLVPNAAAINAAIDASKAAHEAAFAEVQKRVRSTMPSAEIRPFSLIPDVVWNSPAGVFLMTTLNLYPYDAWNIMYLAADERTAMTLDLAPHPGKDVPAFVQASQQFMTTAQAHADKVRARIVETENWAAFTELQDDMRERVKAMAALFARRIAEAWAENSPTRGGPAH
jgi:hypothetical protein